MAKAKPQNKPQQQPDEPMVPAQSGKIDIRINLLSQVAKQLKTVGTIAALLSLPLALTFLLPVQEPTAYPVEPQPSASPAAVGADAWRCRFGGGEWQELPDSCVDLCEAQTQVCAQVITLGCDCGDGQCWDGEKCVIEPESPAEPMMVPDIFSPAP
jgi:hypothetical protein